MNAPGIRLSLPLSRLWEMAAALVPAGSVLASRVSAVDLAYHLRLGDEILRSRRVPLADSLTFGAGGASWVDLQWGAQVLFKLVHGLGSWAGLITLRAVLVAFACWCIFSTCRARGTSARAAAGLTLVAFVLASPGLELRPQLLGVLFFCIVQLLVTRRHEKPRSLWWIPAITAMWANMHGSFPLALLLLLLAFVKDFEQGSRELKRPLSLLALTAGASFISPYGPATWKYVVLLSTHPTVRGAVSEWEPASLESFPGYLLFLSGLIIAGFLARRSPRPDRADLLALGLFFAIALPAIRGMLWWGLAMPVIIAQFFPARKGAPREERTIGNAVLAGVLAVGTLAVLPWWRASGGEQARLFLREAPIAATEATDALVPGTRVLVDQPWASWFEYAAPQLPVFVDPRIELFPADVWEDYALVRFGVSGYGAILDRWQIDAVLLDRTDWPLDDVIRGNPEWTVLFEDSGSAVFVRTE